MPHSFVCNWQHFVFSTKERRSAITGDMQEPLWRYMATIAKNHEMTPLAVGGGPDHAHLSLGLPGKMSNSDAIRVIKANSSKWISEHGKSFAWQEGFASFSVSVSNLTAVSRYIGNQPEHHRKRTFEDELVAMLKKHKVPYDPRYLFG
jgi:putative transposase